MLQYITHEDRINQIKLYYYFMLIDGNLSLEENEKLSSICKENEISEDEKEKMIAKIESNQKYLGTDGSVNIEAVKTSARNLITRSDAFKYRRRLQLETFWNMFCISLSDSDFSKNEAEFLNFVTEKWEINDLIYQEFRDAAETLAFLSDELKWINRTNMDLNKRNDLINRISRQVESLVDEIRVTITEESAPKNPSFYDDFN